MQRESPLKNTVAIPQMKHPSPVLLPVLWALCLAGCFLIIKYRFGILISDDAYITLSHARTWVETGRPVMSVYNPVCATSTPLYTMVIAALYRCTRCDPVPAAWGFNALLDIANIVMMYLVGRGAGLSRLFSAVASTLYTLSILTIGVSASGMETVLYVFLLLSGWYLTVVKPNKTVTAVLSLVLLGVVRPEGCIASVLYCILHFLRFKNLRRALLLSGGAVAGLFIFFVFYYFAYGNVLPHSVIAKKAALHTPVKQALGYWMDTLFFCGPDVGGRRTIMLVNVLTGAVAAAGLIASRKNVVKTVGVLLVWPLVNLCFFIVTGASHRYFSWYYLPELPFLIVTVVYGLQQAALHCGMQRYRTVGWIALSLFCCAVTWRTLGADTLAQKHRKVNREREGIYQQVALCIDSVARSGESVMVEEVGTVGYFLKHPIVDLCGLISPEAVANGLTDDYRVLWRYAPDWIILQTDIELARAVILARQHYRLYRIFAPLNNDRYLGVWRKTE